MKKPIMTGAFLVTVALFSAFWLQARSIEQVQPIEIESEATTANRAAPSGAPFSPKLTGSRQGYQLVTDVIDGFGGKSASDNYGIPVNSGGQPSAMGISSSTNYWIKGGFVHASFVISGDANGDGAIGAGDIVYLLGYLYRSGPAPAPMEAGDANCDGVVGAGDIVYLISYLYRGGPPPAC